MRIGVVGTGNMGRALGLLWTEAGHDVRFGARRREMAQAAVALSGGRATAGTPAEAAQFGQAILWTVPDVPAAKVLGDQVGLADRVLIDLTNGPPRPDGRSRAAALQAELPEAHVIKAFNTLSLESLELCPDEARAQHMQTLLAGDHDASLDAVARLARDIGIEPVWCGGLEHAADIEAAARILIGRILERDHVLLRLSLEPLAPAPRAARLGERA